MDGTATPQGQFSKESIAFLSEVKRQNSKEWYDNNKSAYKIHLLEPFQHLVESLTPTMQRIDPCIEVSPAIGKTVSRIYRDTRFSKDKSRFRDRMWLTFKRDKKHWIDSPVYFFEIRPESFYYGLGYYAATRATMDRVRENILRRENEFRHATAHLLPVFELAGEAYKHPLQPDQPEEIATWYNRKSFSVMQENHDIAELFNPQLVNTLAEAFTQLAPLYTFLIRVEEEKNSDVEQQRSRLFG
ncbi:MULTISPECIES: DUF2461 domain-containing protein [unclassified Serratia (in: enterobacteria)]|uniref:DUF2461 domain-containing protein n=1 Tax=unclassified Serratia (in: enterobacteria) TaxID=2647522 RepID=UPI0027FE46BF|nr:MULTISPECIES: DUF2461 domain-containing protein [unclassified Serratia (in: enterobacteria)]MDQ7097742.1 DUF2461 domain-containing protein [Serratia sp. MF2]MDQ7105255.1 DUF2461 domain-containing protein [Serratia sp. MF1(2023)]